MKTFFFTTLAAITLPFFLASVVSAQSTLPCGNIIAPTGWLGFFDSQAELINYPINDCLNPFNAQPIANYIYKFILQGSAVSDGATVQVADGTTDSYTFDTQNKRVSTSLFLHNGNNYQFVNTDELPIVEADYRQMAAEFFPAGTDIEPFIAAYESSNPYRYFSADDERSTQLFAFDDYIYNNWVYKRPPLTAGTYTAVFREILIIPVQKTFIDKLVDLLIPTAHAFTGEDVYTVTFTIVPTTPEPAGASSVLFLPGIMGSRLYEDADGCNTTGEGQERWLSLSVCDQLRLMMNSTGNSINDIYTKPGQSSILVSQVYKTFFDSLAEWKSQEIIEDYVAVPYDWRLGLDSLLKAKKDNTGKIRFDVTSSVQEGYLYQTLAQLADDSFTGKVTIVTHSNGGLLAKALLATLDRDNDPLADKVDVLIMVAPPQLGTPDALVGILHGSRISPYLVVGNVVSQQTSRQLLGTMPFAHHLLPSSQYFNSSGVTVDTPVLTFDAGSLTTPWATTYGNTVTTAQGMQAFMQTSSGRVVPAVDDLDTPAVVSGTQFNYANSIHLLMNAWVPASTTKVYQIAGVGVQTVSGIRYYTGRECGLLNPLCLIFNPKILYQVKHTIDGDGTVVTPSALAMSDSNSNIERRWLNLERYNEEFTFTDHSSILNVPEINLFIQDILKVSTSTNYQFITETTPNIIDNERLDFYLHSPLDMTIKLSNGTVISSSSPETNQGVYRRYGELQYISVPNTPNNKTLSLKGTATGSFTLEIEEYKNGSTTKRQTYSAIPSSTSTLVTVALTDSGSLPKVIVAVDYDGNGSVDSNYDTSGLVVTYADLFIAINSLNIPPLHKKILLETAKIAEQNYNKSLTNSKFKKAEKLSLNVLKQQVLLYGKLKIISPADQQKIVSIIDNLLNK